MGNISQTDPVALLRDIEASCRRCAHGLPLDREQKSEWSGIGFRLGGNSLVTPLGEVVEILELPELTPVPMTRPWIRGIANVRGKLLTVVDLGGYLQDAPVRLTTRTRVLVVDHNELYAGLIVDEVLGMKHFMNQEYVASESVVEEYLQPYTRNGFIRDERYWNLFSLHVLAESSQFLRAAV